MTSYDLDNSVFLSCPFCGAGEFNMDVSKTPPTMDGRGGDILSARLQHWCEKTDTRRLNCHMSIGGRTVQEAIDLWNTRQQ